MNLRTTFLALSSASLCAGCNPDATVAPTKTVKAPSFAISESSRGGTYIVLTSRPGAIKDLSARVASLGGKVDSYHEGAGLAVVSGIGAAAAAQLGASGVGSVQADFQIGLDAQLQSATPEALEVASDVTQSQTNPAVAARYAFQWNMRLIHAQDAWAAGKLGSPNVRVAIIDTGLDYDAPDLNGLIDLQSDTSFMNHFVGVEDDTTTVEDEYTPIIPSDDTLNTLLGRNLINDLNGHGTNVANQISSKGVALAGVTSRTTIFGVKVLGANGYGSVSDILNGVLWAADHNADVANMSLGGGFSKAGNGQALSIINRVFNYARKKGMLIVVAAGNSSVDLQHIGNGYATYCDAPHVICVSSVGPRTGADLGTSHEDEPSFFSNFGRSSVDVAAPGGNAANGFPFSVWPWTGTAFGPNDVASWVWGDCAKQKLVIKKNADGVHGDLFFTACSLGNRIFPYIGTSQASPHVAGLAALLIAEKGKGNPEAIKRMIQRSGDDIDPSLGRSRINVARTLGL
jgi:lantibiotic leader peptide-processing serine protease